MIVKKKQLEKNFNKLKTNKKCFNCRKKGNYVRDSLTSSLNNRKPKKSLEEAKCSWWKNNQTKTIVIRSTTNFNNSNIEPQLVSQACMTRAVNVNNKKSEIQFLDSCALRYICNYQEKFIDLQIKTYKFVMTGGDII